MGGNYGVGTKLKLQLKVRWVNGLEEKDSPHVVEDWNEAIEEYSERSPLPWATQNTDHVEYYQSR